MFPSSIFQQVLVLSVSWKGTEFHFKKRHIRQQIRSLSTDLKTQFSFIHCDKEEER